jgi:hypothetical protein
MHMRRMFRLRTSEHGEPVFDEAQGIYKKIRIALDQMVVHRAQIQPDRYAINIDVQELPPTEQMRTVQRWKQSLRSKLAFGQGAGSNALGSPDDFTSFYNAMALDTVLWVARPKGYQHTVDRIQGTTTIPDVYDIELLTDLFYSIIGMPKSWFFGSKDGGQNAPSGKALLAQDMRFLRKVKSIRRPVINSYTWLGYFHAILKGKDPAQLDIRAKMPPIGGLEEQIKLELLKSQAEVLQSLADVMDKFHLPKEAWVEVIFRRYLHLPQDVLNVFITSLPDEVPMEGRKPAPTVSRLLKEVEAAVGNNKSLSESISKLKFAMDGGLAESPGQFKPFKTIDDVLKGPKGIKEDDLVVSSFGNGRDPVRMAKSLGKDGGPAPINDSKEPGYRRYI